MANKDPLNNPFIDPPENKTDSEKGTELRERCTPEKNATTYMFNSNYSGPELNGTLMSVEEKKKQADESVNVDGDRTEVFLSNSRRTRLVAWCRDFGVRVVTLLNSKPCFFACVAILAVIFALTFVCTLGFIPMAAEKQHLSSSLNDTSKLLHQCSLSFELLQDKCNETKAGFSQCLLDKDTAHKLVEATEKEKVQLKNIVADLRSKLEAQTREIDDLQKSMGEKVNSAASFWSVFSSSHSVKACPLLFVNSLLVTAAFALYNN